MNLSKKNIKNINLFGVHHPILCPSLKKFVESKHYPWELLGKNLEQFLINLIESVPESLRIQGKFLKTPLL